LVDNFLAGAVGDIMIAWGEQISIRPRARAAYSVLDHEGD